MRHLVLILLLPLASCGGPLSLLTGGGPNVAANVQAGQTNTQTLGTTEIREVHQVVRRAEEVEQVSAETQVKTEAVETLVLEQQIDGAWIVAFTLWSLFLFWLPSPNQLGEFLARRFRHD